MPGLTQKFSEVPKVEVTLTPEVEARIEAEVDAQIKGDIQGRDQISSSRRTKSRSQKATN